MSTQSIPQYTYLYQSLNGDLNFPRYAKYPPEQGGWCDLYNEIEHLSEDYILHQLAAGRVRDYKLEPEADAELIVFVDHLDTVEAVKP